MNTGKSGKRPGAHPGNGGVAVDPGAEVRAAAARTLDAVLRSHADQGYGFDHTEVPLRLLAGPHAGLESRAQARRVAARLTQFTRARLDFGGIEDIGPAFADELFRVFARAHPEVALQPESVAPRVAEMIAAVR